MIVVDASALKVFILKGEGWENLAEYLIYGLSVDYVAKELTDATWKTAYLSRCISREESIQAYRILKKLVGRRNIVLEPEGEYLDTAFKISSIYRIPVYDSFYQR